MAGSIAVWAGLGWWAAHSSGPDPVSARQSSFLLLLIVGAVGSVVVAFLSQSKLLAEQAGK